jgi:5S rRNA maturation endonuclease (ribonuclease M5)
MNSTQRRVMAFLEFLRDFIDQLNSKSDNETVVLVEGKRDIIAMREIGFTGNIVSINSFLRMKHNGSLSVRKVIILTDFDREGRYLTSKLYKTIPRMGIGVSIEERRQLLEASKGLIYNIENLSRFAALLSS